MREARVRSFPSVNRAGEVRAGREKRRKEERLYSSERREGNGKRKVEGEDGARQARGSHESPPTSSAPGEGEIRTAFFGTYLRLDQNSLRFSDFFSLSSNNF